MTTSSKKRGRGGQPNVEYERLPCESGLASSSRKGLQGAGSSSSSGTPFTQPSVMTRTFRVILLVTAVWGLYRARFHQILFHGVAVNRFFINLSIFFLSMVLLLSWYLDVYRKTIKKEKVEYKRAKTTTHLMIASLFLSGISLAIGVWPQYGWATPFLLVMLYLGIFVHLVLILPEWIQRAVLLAGYVWFMHNYLALSYFF